MSKNENYDISLSNNSNLMKETELVELDSNHLKKGSSGYSQLINENEISTSSELLEIENDNNEDGNINKKLSHEIFFQEEINYRKGNLHTFLYDINGNPKIVIGPDWGYALFLHLFLLVITILFYIGLWQYLFIYIKILGIIIYLLFFTTYTLTCIMNPGIITPIYYLEYYQVEKMKLNNYRICSTCNAIQDLDKGVEHCSDCDVCIIGNDHHCPWSSKCIGYKNINMFRYFICCMFVHIFFLTFSAVIAAINVGMQKNIKK